MPCTVQNGAELRAPGDEYNKSLCREGSPRLLKDKTHRPTTPSGIFSRIFTYLAAHARLALGKEWIPEGVVRRWVLSLSNRGLPSLHGDLLYSSPGAPSSAPFWTMQGMGRFPFDQIFRFEIPGIPCDEWNSIFRFVGLPNPRSSGSKFRAKIRDQTDGSFTIFNLLWGCSTTLKLK